MGNCTTNSCCKEHQDISLMEVDVETVDENGELKKSINMQPIAPENRLIELSNIVEEETQTLTKGDKHDQSQLLRSLEDLLQKPINKDKEAQSLSDSRSNFTLGQTSMTSQQNEFLLQCSYKLMQQICSGLKSKPSLQQVIKMLRTPDKSKIQQELHLQDESCVMRQENLDMANGCLRYTGQVKKLSEKEMETDGQTLNELMKWGLVLVEPDAQESKAQDDNQQGDKSQVEIKTQDQLKTNYLVQYGFGKLMWPDNSSFEGYWVAGQPCGVGVFRFSQESSYTPYKQLSAAASSSMFNKEEIFDGIWQQDKATGLSVFRQSVLSRPNSQPALGLTHKMHQSPKIFKNQHTEVSQSPKRKQSTSVEEMLYFRQRERQEGRAVEVWSDGSYYIGTFEGGIKQGEGVYYWADGSRYEGLWINDEMNGEGTFQWSDGRYFHGTFQSGVMHGFGIYTWLDGRKYEGQYQMNKKHGQGNYTYSDGSTYKGAWLNGLQHGVGMIIDADQTLERKGIWAKGKLKQWLEEDQPQI